MAETVLETLVIKVDSDTSSAESGLTGLQKTLSKFKGAATTGSSGTKKLSSSFSSFTSKARGATAAFRTVSDTLGSWFKESNDYVEALNLFNVAMGDCAEAAMDYAKTVEAVMGIDLKEWLTYQGAFFQMADGYGIASASSEKMSQNLTQLAYDLSSLWNTDVETAFQKLQSGMSGQIKGLKAWGINVSVAQLRQTALAHGIDLSTSKMTEAQKATLRYVTIMEQTTNAQGDLARTIITPSNALRILNAQWTQAKRVMGQVVSVIAVKIIPWFQALVQIIKEAAQSLASFLGYELPDIDYSDVSIDTGSFDNAADSLGEAADNAKELKKSLLGIDELNVMTDNSSSSAATDMGGGYASDFGLDLSQYDYDFLSNIKMPDLEPLKEAISDILADAVAIGAVFGSWKIASAIHTQLPKIKETLSEIKGLGGNVAFNFTVGGLGFLSDLMKLRDYIDDIKENGFNFSNVAGVISEGIGMIGDALIVLGNTKVGAGFKIMQGVGELISSISDMSNEGVNWDNVTDAIRGISNIGIALGLLTGNTIITGVSMTIQGITDCVNELSENWDAIKQGDWSGVDKATLITGVIEALGGIVTALGVFSKIKSTVDTAKATTELQEVATATESINTTTSTLTSKMTSLVKNLALGIVVIAEVAVAAGIIVGAIWGLGVLLEQVGKAWQPVIDNGDTVAIAMGIGTGILVAVGVVTALLGAAGTSLIVYMALGIAMLALLGVSAGLFLTEIWAIGVALEQIGIAWQPVINERETVETAILNGTALLVAVGVASAALGVASVASVGLLPVAIALGTAMLSELTGATIVFIDNLDKVATAFTNKLAPTLNNLNAVLPDLTNNMDSFTEFMVKFAKQSWEYSKNSAITGFAQVVDNIAKFFSRDPINAMADDVYDQYEQTTKLNEKLNVANPEFVIAIALMKKYYTFLEEIEKLTQRTNNISLASGMFTSMKEVGKNLITGFVGGMKAENSNLSKEVKNVLANTFTSRLAKSYGNEFGRALGSGVVSGFRNTSFPTLKGLVNVTTSGSVSLKLKAYATGGFPETGEIFIAEEAGPEMVGTIGNKSAVVNNEQIIAGISKGVADANDVQNILLREIVKICKELLDKPSDTVITTSQITDALSRMNRRAGQTVVPTL